MFMLPVFPVIVQQINLKLQKFSLLFSPYYQPNEQGFENVAGFPLGIVVPLRRLSLLASSTPATLYLEFPSLAQWSHILFFSICFWYLKDGIFQDVQHYLWCDEKKSCMHWQDDFKNVNNDSCCRVALVGGTSPVINNKSSWDRDFVGEYKTCGLITPPRAPATHRNE